MDKPETYVFDGDGCFRTRDFPRWSTATRCQPALTP